MTSPQAIVDRARGALEYASLRPDEYQALKRAVDRLQTYVKETDD